MRWHAVWLAILGAALALAAGAPADAWISPFDVSGADYAGGALVDTGGDMAAFSWRVADGGRGRLLARTAAGGVQGPILTLSAPDESVSDFKQAASADGGALFVWLWRRRDTAGVRARRLAAGRLSPTIDVHTRSLNSSTGTGYLEQIQSPALDAAGNAVISWTSWPGTQVRTLSAAGDLGPIVEIPTPGERALRPAVGFGAGGYTVVAWGDHARPDRLLARTASATSGRIGPVVVVWKGRRAQDHVTRRSVDVAVGARGDAIVTWTSSPRYRDSAGDRPQARMLRAGGELGALLTLAGAGPDPWQQAAVAPGGQAVIAWRRGGSSTLQARTLSFAGALGRSVRIARVGRDSSPDVDIADDGVALLGWERDGHALTRSLSANGALGPPVSLSGDDVAVARVQVAAGRVGVVTWEAGAVPRLRAAIDPATRSRLRAPSARGRYDERRGGGWAHGS